MLNANGSILADNRSAASQWAGEALGLPEVQVQARLRGNHLHILCEAAQCPSQELVTARLTRAIEQTDLTRLLPEEAKIYQLFLCGRKLGSRQNDWTVRLDCNSIKEQQQQRQQQQQQPKVSPAAPTSPPDSEPAVSPKKGGFFGKFKHDNRKLKQKPESVKTQAQPPQVREELDFDAESLPIASRIEYPEVFETAPVTIDTSAAQDAFSPPTAPQKPEKSSTMQSRRGAVALIQSPETDFGDSDSGGTLTVSPESLARLGYPDAIASYLSEILGPMGVSVKVSIREKALKTSRETLESNPQENLKPKKRRLLVLCESAYSPDPSLLAEPIASRLRKLKLEGFVEAAIGSQVAGEAKPDWVLRVDLTPPDTILKEWARWGDVPAIAKLLNQHLAASRVEVRATLKEATLHLFCSKTAKKGQKLKRQEYPDKQPTTEAIAPMLASFAPQGIRAAAIYGVEPVTDTKTEPESPVWIEWVDLPAAHHPDLAASPRALAAEGDQLALTFLLNRFLNPNLKRKLETGGIRAVALHKANVLHVMTEALTCPSQSKVGPQVVKFLRQLQIPGVAAVRVYGRRAGQKLPLWRYGIDLTTAVDEQSTQAQAIAPAPSQLAVMAKEAVPEFAVAEDGSFSGLGDNLVFDAPAADSWRSGFKIAFPGYKLGEQFVQAAVQPLVASGLFVPNDGLSTAPAARDGAIADRTARKALMWAIAGCLLTFSTDWLLGQFLQSATVSQAPSASEVCSGPNCQNSSPKPFSDAQTSLEIAESPSPDTSSWEVNLPRIPLQPSPRANREEAFNGSGFTKPGNNSVPVADVSTIPVFPTLRSEQLDEQIARYQEYIREHQKPPDILIVGSSRALRGIDPAVLETALASGGYPGLKAYNFGVNGATLQVVDSLLRRILPPEQLPKLIVLADGARALNSGRPDLTFSAIASSEGYRQLSRGSFLIRTTQLESPTSKETASNPVATAGELVQNLEQSQAKVQQLLSQKLVESSATYKKRDRLKEFLRSIANPSAPVAIASPQTAGDQQTTEKPQPAVAGKKLSDFQPNGFLPIDIRFNPDTYFQKHPKVSGYYDSDYQDFQLSGEQTVALKNLIEFSKVRNINFVFVNMPLTVDYLDPVRAGYEQEFREYMQQLAAQTGLIFRDKSLLWPQARESFSDPSHLNRYGAVAVSKRLAQDPMIPWPAKN